MVGAKIRKHSIYTEISFEVSRILSEIMFTLSKFSSRSRS